MSKLTFQDLHLTGLSEEELLRRAEVFHADMNARYGDGTYSLQEAIDQMIDSEAEYAQGEAGL